MFARTVKISPYKHYRRCKNQIFAKKCYYLYPQSRGHDNIELRMNSGSTYERNVCPRDDVIVYKCGLKTPCDVIDYEEFKVKIKKSEENIKNIIFNNKKMMMGVIK